MTGLEPARAQCPLEPESSASASSATSAHLSALDNNNAPDTFCQHFFAKNPKILFYKKIGRTSNFCFYATTVIRNVNNIRLNFFYKLNIFLGKNPFYYKWHIYFVFDLQYLAVKISFSLSSCS